MIRPYDTAPDFTLVGDDGFRYTLSAYRGSWVVVYFYPADDTPGCTIEACMIRDVFHQFAEAGVVVFGISRDTVESHQKFKAKYELPFILLSDSDGDVISDYDCQNALGATKRTTYIINPEGSIAKIYPQVDPATHAIEVLQDLESLMSAQ